MKKIYYLLLIIAAGASAQKNLDPTGDDVALAKKLRAQFTKEDVAILESSNTITFGVNKSGDKVTAVNKIHQKLMNINHRADIQKFEFYDSESKIESFDVRYRNDKSAKLSIKDEFYKDSDLFYNDARVRYVTVDFPVQGYSYNYEVAKSYSDVKYFTSLYFNEEYPVMEKTMSITVPDWLNLEIKEFNFAGHDILKTVSQEKNATTYTFKMVNIPSFHQERNAPGKSYIYPHILLIAKSFTHQGTTTQLFNSSADLYGWYKSLVDMLKDDPSVFKDKVDELTSNARNDEEKVRNLYYWVQDNIRYIAFEDGIAGFKPDESNNVFTKRYGDCKGMANLLKQMLKLAGFDPRLTWIGTKHLAYDYSTPSLAVDNHMICTVMLNGTRYFLDGTEKFMPLGTNADRIQNKEVLIEDGENYILDKVPADTHKSNAETYSATLSVQKEALVGSCTKTYSGQSCSEFLYGIDQMANHHKNDALENYLGRYDKNVVVDNVSASDMSNREQQLKIDYDIIVNNKVSSFDDEMYVDIELIREFEGLDLTDRKTDYEFGYKTNYLSTVALQIPTGYKIKNLPEDLEIINKDFHVSITYTKTAEEIICKKAFIFNRGVIQSSEFNTWNDINKKIKSVYNQPIVFVKS